MAKAYFMRASQVIVACASVDYLVWTTPALTLENQDSFLS